MAGRGRGSQVTVTASGNELQQVSHNPGHFLGESAKNLGHSFSNHWYLLRDMPVKTGDSDMVPDFRELRVPQQVV